MLCEGFAEMVYAYGRPEAKRVLNELLAAPPWPQEFPWLRPQTKAKGWG